MGTHFKMTCWKCGNEDWSSRVSPTFGCRTCAPAKGTPEYTMLRDGAGRGEGNGNNKHRLLYEKAFAAAEEVRAAKQQAKTEAAERRAQRAKKEKPLSEEPKTTAEQFVSPPRKFNKSGPGTYSVAELNNKVDRILFEMDFTKRVEVGLASLPRVPRCCCCPERLKLTETEDGKLFCPICAYGVLRTGYCTFHATNHYPELNGTVPHLHLSEYPRELLGVDPSRFKEIDMEAIIDP